MTTYSHEATMGETDKKGVCHKTYTAHRGLSYQRICLDEENG